MLLDGDVLQCLSQDRHIRFVSQERHLTQSEEGEQLRCPNTQSEYFNNNIRGLLIHEYFMYLCIFVVFLVTQYVRRSCYAHLLLKDLGNISIQIRGDCWVDSEPNRPSALDCMKYMPSIDQFFSVCLTETDTSDLCLKKDTSLQRRTSEVKKNRYLHDGVSE